jgi:hypothetical protein
MANLHFWGQPNTFLAPAAAVGAQALVRQADVTERIQVAAAAGDPEAQLYMGFYLQHSSGFGDDGALPPDLEQQVRRRAWARAIVTLDQP